MSNLILNSISESDENTLLTVKNTRVFAVFFCVLVVLISLFFGAAKEAALGVFLGVLNHLVKVTVDGGIVHQVIFDVFIRLAHRGSDVL